MALSLQHSIYHGPIVHTLATWHISLQHSIYHGHIVHTLATWHISLQHSIYHGHIVHTLAIRHTPLQHDIYPDNTHYLQQGWFVVQMASVMRALTGDDVLLLSTMKRWHASESLLLRARLPDLIVIRWSPTFLRCFDPWPKTESLTSSIWWVSSGGQSIHYLVDIDLLRGVKTINLSAASPNHLTAAFLGLLHIPSPWNVDTDCLGDPLHPTSTGNKRSILCHCYGVCLPWLFLSAASLQSPSHGIVCSKATKVFDCLKNRTASARSDVSKIFENVVHPKSPSCSCF
jgi:hypothetical protein